MKILRVPLINANEDVLEIVEITTPEGTQVKAGDVVCVVESTKATLDVEAPIDGYVREWQFEAGRRAPVGAILCAITDTPDEEVAALATPKSAPSDANIEATRKAKALAEEYGVDLKTLGIDRIIREADVRAAIDVAASSATSTAPARAGLGARAVVLGVGGHARAVVDLVRSARPDLHIEGAVVDARFPPADVLDVQCLGTSELLEELLDDGVMHAMLGVGAVENNAARIPLFLRLRELGFDVPSLVHRTAAVERSVRMGHGNQVFAGAVLGSNVTLGDNTIINSGAVVSHDTVVGSHTHITPGATLAGGVSIGENSVVGMGATIYMKVQVGRDVVIMNGSHVTRDVPDGTVVKGAY